MNGYLFPRDNIRALRQILLEVISNGKISPLARNIASIGRNTAKNLMVSEAIDGYASLLQNILRLPSEVTPPKAVSDIPPKIKEQWQWHLFEAVPNMTYSNRTLRSSMFLDKYEGQWNHSHKNRSTTTVAANDIFVYSIWEDERYTHLALTKKRREDEEVRSKNSLIYRRERLFLSRTSNNFPSTLVINETPSVQISQGGLSERMIRRI